MTVITWIIIFYVAMALVMIAIATPIRTITEKMVISGILLGLLWPITLYMITVTAIKKRF